MNLRYYMFPALAAFALTTMAQVNGSDAPGFFIRGVCMFGDANYIGSEAQLRQAVTRGIDMSEPERAAAARLQAMDAMHEGRYDRAELMLQQWLKDYPQSPFREDVRMCIADCVFTRSYADALKKYDAIDVRALTAPRAEELAYRIGFCCLKLAEFDRAEAAYRSLEHSREYGDASRFYLGYIAYARRDYARAKQIFSTVNTMTEPGCMADYYLAQIYYSEGEYTRALTCARALLKRQGVSKDFVAETNRIAGESLYLMDRPAEAIPYLRKYREQTALPLTSALYILGLSEYSDGDYNSAIKTLRPVTDDNSSMGQNAYLYVGQALMKQGDTDGAIMAFDRALRMDYDDDARESAYYNYAVAKYSGGMVPFGSSVSTFEDFLRQYPESRYADEVRRYIITGYVTDNNYEAALKAINDVRNPSADVLAAKQQVLYTLGARSLGANSIESAVKYLTEANTLRGDATVAAEIRLALGEALLRSGNASQAIPYLREYLSTKDARNSPVAYYDLGYAYMAGHEYPKALESFRNVIKAPRNIGDVAIADAWARIGDCYYYAREWSDAANAYGQSYDRMPSSGDYALFQMAVMQGYAGDFQAKLEGMRRLVREFPSSSLLPDAMLEMTEAYLRTGDTPGAIRTWRMLIEKYPNTSQGRQAYLQLALTLAETGRTDEALETYKALIANYPTSDEASQASETLKQMYAELGRLDEYVSFISGVENAPKIDASELERMSYDAADRAYLDGKGVRLLDEYVAKYPEGQYAVQAYAYLMDDADASGNDAKAYTLACTITDTWPDNSASEQAYAIRAAREYALGDCEQAMQSWHQLERRASTPAMTNEARMGIMRSARDLGRADELLTAADAVLASSTLGAEDKTEAAFSRGLAMQIKGDDRGAITEWRPLASLTDDLYGAKSAVYLAETLFEQGDRNGALSVAQDLVNSGTPHAYWLARGFIVLSDIYRANGRVYEADEYLKALRENYPGSEADIFSAIEQRLKK